MKLLVLGKETAIYRVELLQQVYQNLPSGSEITIMYGYDIEPANGWKSVEELNQYDLKFKHACGAKLDNVFTKLFKMFFSSEKGEMVLFPMKELKKYGIPDVLWVHEVNQYTIPAMIALRNKSKIVISTEVGKGEKTIHYNRSTFVTHRVIGMFADGLIARSRAAYRRPTITTKPIIFAPYGVNTNDYKMEGDREENDLCRMIFVGQFIHRKGIDLLASACELLLQRGVTGFEVKIVGKGDDELVDSEIRNRNLDGVMRNCGFYFSKELPELYRDSDVFVFPSRADTHAVVVHEAATSGLAMLVSKFAGSASLLVEDGVGGYIIDPHNTVAFADRMQELIEDPLLVASMKKETEKKAKELCVEKTGREVAQFILDL